MRVANNRLLKRVQSIIKRGFYSGLFYILIPVESGTYDEYNNPVVTVSQVPINGSFSDITIMGSLEEWKTFGDVGHVDAEIRYDGVEPKKGYTVLVSERFDEGIVENTFEIISIKNRGIMGWVCALRKADI